jgi:hypothetical protein
MGVSLAVLQNPFPKPILYKQLKENLSLHQFVIALSRQRTRHLKKHGKQEPLCAISLDEYALMTNAQQFAIEKAIEAEQRWSKLSLDVCHVCDGCHLTKMCRTTVEFGHTIKRESKPICGSCAHNPARNTAQKWVIPYWLDKHGIIHTNVPGELNDLTFAEKQLIALDSSHMSLIHIKNGTLDSRGHCVSVEQKISELFTTPPPRKPGDLNLLNVRRSWVFKVLKYKVLAALYWLVKHNVLYQEYEVVIDPSTLDWMGDENECILPIPSTIQTYQDGIPEDDDMVPSARQTLMEKLDKMEGLDLEVSGTIYNTDCSPPTEEDARLLEEIRNSKTGKEKGATIN